ncbi:hydrolase [Salipaludibacillus neizhouensis]|uniref:Hydrolase n=1 Tax=Salipaludibacillus neizhouensis TaxID=885475 RepID=A0A3A9JZP8_9BACI|nr:family 43 glycosylhydrolase [Salipaludibacillus neizhouensis]RKL65649.1 hydrolase [Salipaludibacillus neizhouensis]
MKKPTKILFLLLFLLAFTSMASLSFAAGENQILHYEMNNIDGTTVPDTTGNFDADWINPENSQWINGGNVGAINFEGGSTSSYIEMPEGVLDDLESVSVSAIVNWKGNQSAEWLYALGQDSDKYTFFTPRNGAGVARLGLGITSWRNEANATSSSDALTSGDWKLVTTVIDGEEETLTLYIDGVEKATGSTNGYTLEEINNTNGRSGFIGRSFYSGDPYFGGMIADFQVHNGALSTSEIAALIEASESKIENLDGLTLNSVLSQLDYTDFINQNGSKDEITTDLSLPSTGSYSTTITWESLNQEVITNKGQVNRPSYEEGSQEVVLIATVSDGNTSVSKEFEVTVLRELSDSEVIIYDMEELMVHNIDNVLGNLTLPTTGEYGSTISWESEDSSIITSTGEVIRPSYGDGNTSVKLTATLSRNDETIIKKFTAEVKELPLEEDFEGYLFTYMPGEGFPNGEQIYFGLSEGNNPLNWNALNNGEAVISSVLGDEGVRDAHIIRSPEGDKFYMIATDLRIRNNTSWGQSVRNGSRSIMVWESTDLIHWSEQRMVEVAPPEAGNTWAPESFYDETTGEYIVFWASSLYENEEQRANGNSYHRMMYAKTRDFHTFTEPEVYMDFGYSIIDTTMIEHDGGIHRITKGGYSSDTRPVNDFVFQEVGDSVLDPDFEFIKEGIGIGDIDRGEGPAIFKSNTEEKWYLLIDEYGGRGYILFETTDLISGDWKLSEDVNLPNRARHGTVLPITQEEHQRLQEYTPGVKEPSPLDPIEPSEKPILKYNFEETSTDNSIQDGSGNDYTGTLHGNAAYVTDEEKDSQVLYLDGTNNTFAAFPTGFFDGKDTVTISMDIKAETVSGNFFTFAIGSNNQRYMFLRTRDTAIRNAITVDGWQNEEVVSANTASIENDWINVNLVITPTSMAMYKDGILVDENNNVTTSISDLGTDLLGYLGRSFYTGDAFFRGSFDNVEVFNRALSKEEIQERELSSTGIANFEIPEQRGQTEIDSNASTIKVAFKGRNVDVTNLTPSISVLSNSTVTPASGEAQDFTDPVIYTVTDEDDNTQEWTVSVEVYPSATLPGLYADPQIHVSGDTFYMYPTTDGFESWSGTQFKAFSSKDLLNWEDHGVIIDLATDDVEWATGNAWAPGFAERDGYYYHYFSANQQIGVSKSSSPTGGFEDALDEPLIPRGQYAGQAIDPYVFTDDDGESYFYWGNGALWGAKLNEDMISLAEEPVNMTPENFREGVVVFKREGTYYLMWSENDTRDENYQVAYATGPSPMGPWTKNEVILSKDTEKGILGTGHHSILQMPNSDDFYIVYHRFAIPDGNGTNRETMIDKMEFNEDGTIKRVVPTLEGITEPVYLIPDDSSETTTEELQSLLDTAKSYTNEGKYTEESFATLESGIAAAEETLENEKATQEDIDAAVTALQAAIDQLEEATEPDPDTTSPGNKGKGSDNGKGKGLDKEKGEGKQNGIGKGLDKEKDEGKQNGIGNGLD